MAHINDVIDALESADVPHVQGAFPEGEPAPYATIWRVGDADFASDDVPLSEYELFLYTPTARDMDLEFAIEDALRERGVTYAKGGLDYDYEHRLARMSYTDINVYER